MLSDFFHGANPFREYWQYPRTFFQRRPEFSLNVERTVLSLPDVSPDVGAAAVEHGDEQLGVPRQVAELDRQPQPLVPLPPFRERLKNAQRIFFEKFRQVFSKRPKVDSIFFNPIKF